SRLFDRITRPEQLLYSLPQAIRVLLDPEHTGAVTISLHQDVQAEAYDYPAFFFAERTWHVSRRPAAADEIERAAELLANAERPLIIAGGGVHYAGGREQLAQLAEALGAPVGETSAGKGAMPDSPWAVGAIGHSGTRAANALARTADVILCAGTRLIDLTTGSNSLFENPDVQFVGLNLAASDGCKLGATPILADAREGLAALTEAVRGRATQAPEWRSRVDETWASWSADLDADLEPREGERLSQSQALRVLNEQAGAQDSVVVASGTPHVEVHKLWDTRPGTRVFMEVGFSCMAHEIPAAIGVRMGRGDQGEVYAVIGDGTYLMSPTELVTAVQEGLKITVVVFQNHGYQSIHALQRGRLGRSFGLEFRHRDAASGLLDGASVEVDIAANARSMGAAAFTAETAGEVAQALAAARAEAGPCVVVIRTEPWRLLLGSECWWDVGVPSVTTRPDTDAAVAASDAGRAQQRYLG
ncbi:MAG TPA: thiamine pyrophosphate-dependent enzyme, partial [Conexibacter sp.]|nr:thiamine pyrophosphate-dependent enzyme [Conexibacter sp.]